MSDWTARIIIGFAAGQSGDLHEHLRNLSRDFNSPVHVEIFSPGTIVFPETDPALEWNISE